MIHYGPPEPAGSYQPSEAIPPPDQWEPMPPDQDDLEQRIADAFPYVEGSDADLTAREYFARHPWQPDAQTPP